MKKPLNHEQREAKRILILEPFADPSHQSFYEGWSRHSNHTFEVCELSNHHWKWRSRHASLTLAEHAKEFDHREFDLVFCSEMLNLAEWRGFAGPDWAALPAVAYFHENQFTYPAGPRSNAVSSQRDMHFAYSNVLTAIAADCLWFNSNFHRDEFCSAACQWLSRMPDYRQTNQLKLACHNSLVRYPGIENHEVRGERQEQELDAPLRIGWVARWEHDKRPDRFLDIVRQLLEQEVSFELILLGANFQTEHPSYKSLKELASSHIRHAGYAESKRVYYDLLADMDVVVSTADHEFFGIGILEAIAAGAFPLLPDRLAYPEVLQVTAGDCASSFLYSTDTELLTRLCELSKDKAILATARNDCTAFSWSNLAKEFDQDVQALCAPR